MPSGETIPLLFSACVPVQLQAVLALCLLVSQVVTRCLSLKLPDVPVTQCWRHQCSAGIHRQTGDGQCWCWASKSCTVIVASHGSCIARCALFALVLCFVRNFVHLLQHFFMKVEVSSATTLACTALGVHASGPGRVQGDGAASPRPVFHILCP